MNEPMRHHVTGHNYLKATPHSGTQVLTSLHNYLASQTF